MRRRLHEDNGFSLVELLVVIVILAALIAIAIPTLLIQRGKAHDSDAKNSVSLADKTVRAEHASANRTTLATSQLLADLSGDHPGLSFLDYATGTSTGPKSVSLSRDSAEMTTTCSRSKSGRVFCRRFDEEGLLLRAAGGRTSHSTSSGWTEASARCALASRTHPSGDCTGSVDDWSSTPTIPVAAPILTYASRRGGQEDIYRSALDGTGSVQLTTTTGLGESWHLDASPNGRIVYDLSTPVSPSLTTTDVWVMNSDGSGQTRLTTHSSLDWWASFFPDGSKIVFVSTRGGSGDIYTMNADGSNQTRLLTTTGQDYRPRFSPDGSKIAFVNASLGVAIVNADGTGLTTVPGITGADSADWSPDGARLAVAMHAGTGQYDIYTVRVDGTGLTQITTHPTNDRYPCFSADGSKIAFIADRTGNGDIYMMNADGSDQTLGFTTPDPEFSLMWK